MNATTQRILLGAAAGLAGTLAIQAVLTTRQKYAPRSMPPMKDEPGQFMMRKLEHVLPEKIRARVPEKTEAIGGKLLGIGYGVTFGVLYAVARPKSKNPWLEGALLGLAAWAAGYLGWLPGTKLMPPVWKQEFKQVAPAVAEHALYGIATVAGYRWLQERAMT